MHKSNSFYKSKTQKNNNSRDEIYLDHASTTPIDFQVLSLMQKIYKNNFVHPSSLHRMGVRAKEILEYSRKKTADILGALPDEIIFTSGSTESNRMALTSVLNSLNHQNQKYIPHIIITNIEHPSVLEVCKHLETTQQARITYVTTEENGVINPKKIKKVLTPETILVSIVYANNEIGTISPLREIAKIIRHFNKVNLSKSNNPKTEIRKVLFHTDATQAMNYLNVKVAQLGVDMMSFSSAKFYGPKGLGVLYIKRNVKNQNRLNIKDTIFNLPGAAGLAKALEIAEQMKNKEAKRLTQLRDYFFKKLANLSKTVFNDANGGLIINGDLKNRLPNNVNITIFNIPSDLLVIELSARGVMASSKSACKEGDHKASHVIKAINKKIKDTDGSLRFSLGRGITRRDIDYTTKALSDILHKLKKWYN